MRYRIRIAALVLAIALGAFALEGCSPRASRLLNPNPEEMTQGPNFAIGNGGGFLPDPARMTAEKRYPFQLSWVQPGTDFRTYSAVMLAPVSLEYLRPPAPAPGEITPPDNQRAGVDAAVFAGEAFVRAVQDDPARRFMLATKAEPKILVVEMAIVRLTPNLQSSTADAFGVPASASAASALQRAANVNARGTIGMELKVRDGRSNEVIAIFSDTRRAPAPSGDERITPGYGFANQIISDWMRQTVAMLAS
ncbi:MAG: DUF3313 family protein [Candidatus Binataceae bacterium]